MEKISFTKMSGAGNDFIVINKDLYPEDILAKLNIKKLCNRRTGVGADGIIFVFDVPGYDFGIQYFNSDGSTGSLCGNGTRCGIWYAKLSERFSGSKCTFISNDLKYEGEVLSEEYTRFLFQIPQDLRKDLDINGYKGDFVNSGSPHFVINIKDNPLLSNLSLDDIDVYNIGKELRYSKFFKEGSNINFVEVMDGFVKIRTYERGVEDETLACGTGSVASAIILSLNNKIQPPVRLLTKSGEELEVNFCLNNEDFSNVTLAGPAKVVFDGNFFSYKFF